MTGLAVAAKLAFMGVVVGMAGYAVGGRAFENAVPGGIRLVVASPAVHLDMSASEPERRAVMVICRRCPPGGRVAVGAGSSQAACVGIILDMARRAVCGCALVKWTACRTGLIVAGFAGYSAVFAIQVEGSQVVVEFRWKPALCCVAGFAGRAKAPFVRFIFSVAGEAVCR